ncbi:hypothetical protein PsorP6_018382 [Peronosclerospora sorghi]|nr:hypothetical protein PsorP6_018382 [Peronosclerospora sorghi]
MMEGNRAFMQQHQAKSQEHLQRQQQQFLMKQEILDHKLEQRKEPNNSDLKVKGVQMPRFHGHLDESLDLFFFNVKTYCQSQNIDMYDPSYFNYAMSLITVNVRVSAAASHQDFEQQGKKVHSIEELKEVMTRKLVPVDLRERLREKLDALKQKHCRKVEEYIMKFRKLRKMCYLYRVMCFTKGLVLRKKQEVLYRRCRTKTEAMTVALEFERSHALIHEYRNNNNQRSRRDMISLREGSISNRSLTRVHNSGVDRDGDEIMDVGNTNLSKGECSKKKLCFYCNKPAHLLAEF